MNKGETKVFGLLVVSFLLILCWGTGVVGEGCAECSPEGLESSPFEGARHEYNPGTFGLPAGRLAPDIPGVELIGQHTIVVVVNGHTSPFVSQLGILAVPGVQLVLAAYNLPQTHAELQRIVGDRVTVLPNEDAFLVCALYRVGSNPVVSPLTFFIDETGTIIYRRFKVEWLAYQEGYIARYFAAHGALPPDILPQYVLWEGDEVPWPPFPLQNPKGEEVRLGPGHPIFLFRSLTSPSSPRGEMVFQIVDGLRKEFPHVDFIWLVNRYSDERVADIFWVQQELGFISQVPECVDLSDEECLELIKQEDSRSYASLIGELCSSAVGWKVIVECDLQLSLFWGLRYLNGVLVIDAQGRVAFPHAGIGYHRFPGEEEVFLHPRLQEVLREAILNALSEG